MHDQVVRSTLLPGPNRDMIHDLRNLFGIVASARHLLDDQPGEDKRAQLLDAIEGAARRGGQLTTDLLASTCDTTITTFDCNARIASLETMIRALPGRDMSVWIDLRPGCLMARLDVAAFDAALLELIANACSASSNHIIIRARGTASRIRLTVADNGKGMSRPELSTALRAPPSPASHGTGLGRVDHFVRQSHGRLRIRSREGCGTIVSMSLPKVLSLSRTGSECGRYP